MNSKRGISLIMLVVTIAVMIILASTAIISLNNNGAIIKTMNTVTKMNKSEVLQYAETVIKEIKIEEMKKGHIVDYDVVKTRTEERLVNKGVDLAKYKLGLKVTVNDVVVKNIWYQEGTTISRGDTVLSVGDTINYEDGVNQYYSQDFGGLYGTFDITWKVLGVEDGELLLISDKIVTYDNFFLEGFEGYLNGITYINEVAAIYGEGEFATGARGINVADINRITGRNVNNTSFDEYGNKVITVDQYMIGVQSTQVRDLLYGADAVSVYNSNGISPAGYYLADRYTISNNTGIDFGYYLVNPDGQISRICLYNNNVALSKVNAGVRAIVYINIDADLVAEENVYGGSKCWKLVW